MDDKQEFHSTILQDEEEELLEGEFEDDEEDDISSQMSIPDDNIDYSSVYALHTFLATVEGQASVVRGDSLILLDDSNAYWWLIRVQKTQELGYIPAENIETPDERLARLNKHRNIDLTSANQSDLSHQHQLSSDGHAPLNINKKQKRTHESRVVAFSAPTYRELVLYPDEIAEAEAEAQRREMEEQENSYEGDSQEESDSESEQSSLSLSSQSGSSHGHIIDEQTHNDDESDIIAPESTLTSDPPVADTNRNSYDSSLDTHSSDNLEKYFPAKINKQSENDINNANDHNNESKKSLGFESGKSDPIPESVMANDSSKDSSNHETNNVEHKINVNEASGSQVSTPQINAPQPESNAPVNSQIIQTPSPQILNQNPSQLKSQLQYNQQPDEEHSATTLLTTNTSPLLDPATSPTRKVTITPDVAQSPDPNLLLSGRGHSPTNQINHPSIQNRKASIDESMTVDSQNSSESSSQKHSIWKSSPLMSDITGKGKDKKLSKDEKKKLKKIQKESSSQSLNGNDDESNSVKKKKSGVFGNLFKKRSDKDRKKQSHESFGDGSIDSSIKSSDSMSNLGSENLSESMHRSTSQEIDINNSNLDSRNISPPIAVKQQHAQPNQQNIPVSFTPLAPLNQPTQNGIRPRNESLKQNFGNDMKASNSNNSLTVSSSISNGLETPSPALSQNSWQSPNTSLNARPGSLLGAPTLNVLRMFAAPSVNAEATFKTVLLNGSTSSNDLVRQAMQRFRLSASEDENDYFLTIKEQESGNESVIEPNQKPLTLFEQANKSIQNKHLMPISNELPKVKRSSVGSISSVNSNLSTLPAISRLSLGDFSDDSAVKLYLHCRKSSSVENQDMADDEDVYAGYMNDPGASSPVFDDFEDSKNNSNSNDSQINTLNNASLNAKKRRESQLLLKLNLDNDKVNICVLLMNKDIPIGCTPEKSLKNGSNYEIRLVIPTNSTVAEIIEQALYKFGVHEGVVDGGDDVDLKIDGYRSAVKYRLSVKPRNKKQNDGYSSLNPNKRIIDANRDIIQLYDNNNDDNNDTNSNNINSNNSNVDDQYSNIQRLSYKGYPNHELMFVLQRADKVHNHLSKQIDDSTDAPSLAEIIARQRLERENGKQESKRNSIENKENNNISDNEEGKLNEIDYNEENKVKVMNNHHEDEKTPVQITREINDEDKKSSSSTTSKQDENTIEELIDNNENRGLGLRDSDSMENYQIGGINDDNRSSQQSTAVSMTTTSSDRITSGEGFDDIIERLWERERDNEGRKDIFRSQSSFSLQTAHTDLSSSTVTGQDYADARSTPLSRRSYSSDDENLDDEKAIKELQNANLDLDHGKHDKKVDMKDNNRESSSSQSTTSEYGRSLTPSTPATTNPTPPSIQFHPFSNVNGTSSDSHDNRSWSRTSSRNERGSVRGSLERTSSEGNSIERNSLERTSIDRNSTNQNTTNVTTEREREREMINNLGIKHLISLSESARRGDNYHKKDKDMKLGDYVEKTWFWKVSDDSKGYYDDVKNDLEGIENELDRLLTQALAL